MSSEPSNQGGGSDEELEGMEEIREHREVFETLAEKGNKTAKYGKKVLRKLDEEKI